MKLYALPFLALLLAAGQCAPKEPIVSTPPAEWTKADPEPLAPHIPDDMSEEEADDLEADFIQRLLDWGRAQANKLKRLDEWREEVSE